MQECFGVRQADEEPQFLATIDSLFDQLHEKIVVGPLEGDTNNEAKA